MTDIDTTDVEATAVELRQLVGRIEQLLTAPVALAALDAYGNPGNVAAGELIESAWGNAVVDHVLNRYPNKAALDTYTPAHGALAITVDNNVVWIRDGAGWKPTAIGNRIAFRLIGGIGQSMASGAISYAAWTTEASDPFNVVAGGAFTVPAAWAGRWAFEWGVNWPGPSSGVRQSFLQNGGARLGQATVMTVDSAAAVDQSGAASAVLAVGNVIQVGMYHTHVGALLCNPSANQYFQGYYVGPY